MLNCHSFEHRLHELLDQHRSLADDQLRLHAANCGRCRQTIDAYDRLFEGLASSQPSALPADFSQRVVAQVVAERESFRARIESRSAIKRRLMGGLLWIAATFLIVVVPIAALYKDSTGVATRPVTPPPADLNLDSELRIEPNDSIAAATPRRFLDPSFVLQEPWRSIFAKISQEMEFDRSRLQGMEQLTAGLEPIRVSLDAALDTLRNTIPIGRPVRTTTTGSESAAWQDQSSRLVIA